MKKFRKIVWKIWGCFLIISVPANILSLLFMACCMDSDSVIPPIVVTINASWLLLLIIANDPVRIEKERRKKEAKKGETRDKKNCA